jgi:molecular chaperone GrpE
MLANRKKRHKDPQQDPAEPFHTPEQIETAPATEENGTDLEQPFENESVAPEEDDAEETEFETLEQEDELEEEPDNDPHRPSARDVLNRLLEKNEIILDLNKSNAEKDKQLKELNDKWLRSVAEFENYRKRTRKEWELLKQQSKAEVILEILNIVDDFERAFSVAEDADIDEFVQGIKLIYNNLNIVLEKFGVQEIDAFNSSFDPNFHMAVGQIETGEIPSGFVAEVVQKGYKLDDAVIRPANVIVAK